MFDCILSAAITYEFRIVIHSQRNLILKCEPLHKVGIFSTSLSFPQGTRITDHYSVVALKTIGFSQELLQT